MTIDLRSDTVTRPTWGMRAAMAETGDDVYAEDPTVNALEERVADMLGHEAGLFAFTGSLANMLGVRAWVGPGHELLCEAQAHVVRGRAGRPRRLARRDHADLVASSRQAGPDGVRRMLSPQAGPYLVSTAAVSVENTHNFAGGTIQPLDDLQGVVRIFHNATTWPAWAKR